MEGTFMFPALVRCVLVSWHWFAGGADPLLTFRSTENRALEPRGRVEHHFDAVISDWTTFAGSHYARTRGLPSVINLPGPLDMLQLAGVVAHRTFLH